MRVLVINPILTRFARFGAEEQDTFAAMQALQGLGHTIYQLSMTHPRATPAEAEAVYKRLGVPSRVVPYFNERWGARRWCDRALWDGAAWEMAQASLQNALHETLADFNPEAVWVRSTFLWPLARQTYRAGLPTLIRSVNFEPLHEFQQEGGGLARRIRALGKWAGEKRALKTCHLLAAITPAEQALYQRLNPQAQVEVLPLQSLPSLLRPPHPVHERQPLQVFFMAASYSVSHNRAALDFVLEEVWPRLRQADPQGFHLHILGTKLPRTYYERYAAPDLHLHGFVDDLEGFLNGMDIALAPSPFGQGMQQKIFEPLCRGFPTVTHGRGLAGYPYQDGESVLVGADAEGYVRQLLRLRDPALRSRLADSASAISASLFSQDALLERVQNLLTALQTPKA